MKERDLQTSLCRYIKLQHPNTPFHVDAGDSKRRSFAEQNMMKKQQFAPGFPDFQIMHASKYFNGLFLELKNGKEKLFYKDGRWKTGDNDYHVLQYDFHKKLIDQGYYACFVWDIEGAIKLINQYMDNVILQPQYPVWGREDQWQKSDAKADKFFNQFNL